VEYSIEFGGEPQDVTVKQVGSVTLEDVQDYLAELFDHPQFRPGMSILMDSSALDAAALSSSDIRTLANDFLRADEKVGEAAMAVLVADSATFGLARMWEAYVTEARLQTRIFMKRDEAIAWLTALKRTGAMSTKPPA
jgi:hypothetical protein